MHWVAWEKLCHSKSEGGVGFRDIRAFNLAVLAKQGWRVIQSPNSIAARVLQAKYYPNTSFLAAPLTRRPSYLWRSFLEGRKLLQLGLRYRIGDGQNVSIWNSPWIPRPKFFRPCTLHRDLLPNGRVCDLIDEITGDWDHTLLNRLFLPFEAELIRTIPIASTRTSDQLIWHFTPNGKYSVKSGYHTQLSEQLNCRAATSNPGDFHNFWSKIWRLNTPPKVRIFIWKVVNKSLPVSGNLHKRVEAVSPICQICYQDVETEIHCIFKCPWTHSIWENIGIRQQYCINANPSDLLQWLFNNASTMEQSLLCITMWLVWKARCRFVLEDQTVLPSVGQIITQAHGIATLLNAIKEPCGLKDWMQTTATETWQPPSPSFSSINVDAGFSKDGSRCSRIVWRDHSGTILWAESEPLPHHVAIIHGELLAIKHGLRFAQLRRIDNLHVWSDCLNAVELLKAADTQLHPLSNLIVECLNLKNSFASCEVLFTRREGNMLAHHTAQLGLDFSSVVTWGKNPPALVSASAYADIS